MGTTKSVIGNNNRVCFYEVVEGVCYCCGDVLETELVTPGQTPTKTILNRNSEGKPKTSGKDLTCDGSDCDRRGVGVLNTLRRKHAASTFFQPPCKPNSQP